MLERLIHSSLHHRIVVLLFALILLGLGTVEFFKRPMDIFPDLNQPTVTVLADAHGLAPEEVETLVTLPLEAALAGAPGVVRIRSSSGDGLSIVRVDFDWDTEIYLDRQMVQERLQLARSDLPEGVVPEMAPIASITGEIMNLGLTSDDGSVSQMKLNTIATWVVRRRLLSVSGVAQVVVIGGEEKLYQVFPDTDLMMRHGVTINELAEVLGAATENTSGGYLVQGTQELLVRNLGRLNSVKEIENVVIAGERERPLRVKDVADVAQAPRYRRGSASINGRPGVMLLVFKQPGSNTLELTGRVDAQVKKIRSTLPEGVQLNSNLYRQATFLQRGVNNVIEALVIGAVLVVIIIFLFLMNFRASVITLVALPLSFATAGVLFYLMDLTLNIMTLGGLAIAVGELVDDAIVGVENVVRRLRQKNQTSGLLELVAGASSEVRGPIFTGTLVVVLVFTPFFALSGIEGRLFTPLAIAYVTSLLASMIVSLTVTPVLCLMLFRNESSRPEKSSKGSSFVMSLNQKAAGTLIRFALKFRKTVIAGSLAAALGVILCAGTFLGSEFLPPFDEGTVLVMTFLPPGTSIDESDRIISIVEKRLEKIEGIQSISRYSGRGSHDEHAPPVTISHILLTIDPDSDISKNQLLRKIRQRLSQVSGIAVNVGQPLAHRIDHILSGVQAQIVIKAMGTDLSVLRGIIGRVEDAVKNVPGATDVVPEPQVLVPQVHVDLDRQRIAELGLSPGQVAHELHTAVGGRVVGHILEEERSFDLQIRLDKKSRDSIDSLRRLPVRLPSGSWARLGEMADVEKSAGPNSINRDNLLRRIALSCNAHGASLGEVVRKIKQAVEPIQKTLPGGTFLSFEGQFTSQLRATRLIVLLSIVALAVMVVILYSQFKSLNLALQVLICIPMAFAGGALLLLITGQPFSIAALVGFVSLCGIAARNGILLISHYLYLMKDKCSELSPQILVQAGRERAAPVVMTALTTGAGLLPLLLAGTEAGREILYPVATVVIGGLATSTLFEFLLRPALFWTLARKTADRMCGPGTFNV